MKAAYGMHEQAGGGVRSSVLAPLKGWIRPKGDGSLTYMLQNPRAPSTALQGYHLSRLQHRRIPKA